MAKKFYVVWQGHKPGIYTTWDEAKRQVDKFPGAKYKSFPTEPEAKAAFAQSANKAIFSASSTASKGPANRGAKSVSASNKTSVAEHQPEALSEFDLVLYTDGGCDPNPGKAGSGVAVYRSGKLSNLWYGLFNPHGTNNTAELNALHEAIKMAASALNDNLTVRIYSDSQYSINCISNWAYGWKAKGWTRKGGEIANLALIKAAHALYDQYKDRLNIVHVAAHVGIEGNELADRMSIYAVDQQQSDFVEYPQPINLATIMAMRAG
ncbi:MULTISPECIES: ribonuclease H family protein [Shewanella]|uniref:Ribonuclease H n=1 Tax=Shewanella holmiensis TaxID=2952222 RepID=A0A9X3ALH4_9GAMM|nr:MULTISPECIES: ribonuclease H family protein [Shewanella]MCT7940636.1 ribonuclease H family protein [Shewanella holmiensis]MDP5145699.1 ribonuclease H family protein [Shewanella sp. ULN5]